MKKPVILCIDDEKIVLTSLKEQLKDRISAYDIEIAESGQEALEIISELSDNQIELPLVISDYVMPGMKGDAVLKSVHQTLPKTVKILLTGQATTEGVTNAVNNANLYRYIAKPWEKEDLCLTINEAVKSFYIDKKLEEQNKKLEAANKELIQLTNAVVETMVAALDTRDTTTAGHSKRLAGYAVKLAETLNLVEYGSYKDFKFTEDQIQELYYAALLHDIGKIGIKESILQKKYRLVEEHQNEIRYRFSYYKKYLEMKRLLGEIDESEVEVLKDIDGYCDFVLMISRRAYITDEEAAKIRRISEIDYVDIDNVSKKLLKDFEVEGLTIKKGNLTQTERDIINTHVDHTYNILKVIPWTKNLENVPGIASNHHERVNGTGYSKGLKADEIIVQAKILAILDIFEALTALDRPYKPPMQIDKALEIIREEVDLGHLDREICEVFVNEKVYDLYKTELKNS